jgi:hypothetical protein
MTQYAQNGMRVLGRAVLSESARWLKVCYVFWLCPYLSPRKMSLGWGKRHSSYHPQSHCVDQKASVWVGTVY